MNILQFTPYTIPLLLATAVSLVLALVVWRRRPGPGVVPFVLLNLAVAEWTFFYCLELVVPTLEVKLVMTSFQYIGIVAVPALGLLFVLDYTGHDKWMNRRTYALLSIQPALVMLLVVTNRFHGLHFETVSVVTEGTFQVLHTTKGMGFWIHAVYSYLIILTATILLIRALVRSPQLYRGQAIYLLIGIFAPWVANIATLTGLVTTSLDLTPFAFTITGLAFGWSLVRFRLLDVAPVAREKVIESMGDAMIVLDGRSRIVDINPAARRLINIAAATDVVGKPAREVLTAYKDLLDKYATTEEAQTEIAIGGAGTQRHYELRISPIFNRSQNLTGRVIILRDITRLKEASEQILTQNQALLVANSELVVAQTRAEESSRLKSEFLATMSHELRTPLNAIIGYADLLLTGVTGDLSAMQRDSLGRVLSNGERLLGLINDILDISKIEAGRLELAERSFSPAELLGDVQKRLGSLAVKKGIALETELDSPLPPTLIGDPTRLEQILANLVGNALRFTDEGSVKVSFLQQTEATWKMTVTDTGVGIPAHALDYIFDEFRQVDGSTQRQHSGTGLGLSIVRKLAVLMGGTVSVQSEVGQGSTFTVQLPLRVAEGSVEEAVLERG